MKKFYLLAAVAGATLATSANALTLVSAAVFGVGGTSGNTIWRTAGAPNTVPGNYTLFVSSPKQGEPYLNQNDQALNFTVSNSGLQRFFLNGDGFPVFPATVNSDPQYRIALGFDNGQTLNGLYSVSGNSFVSSDTVTSGGRTFRLAEFSYNRFLGDTVGQNTAGPGGDENDYNGNFRLSSVAGAVPEPTTWAMMIVGFGVAGAAMRRRTRTSVSFA